MSALAAATVIAAIIAAGTSIGAGVANNRAVERANRATMRTYNKEYQDQLKQQKINDSISRYRAESDRMNVDLRKEELGFTKEKEGYGRAMQSAYDMLGLLNQDRELQSNFMSFFQRK